MTIRYAVGRTGDYSFGMWPVLQAQPEHFAVLDTEEEAEDYLINLLDCQVMRCINQAQDHAQQAYRLRAERAAKAAHTSEEG